MATPRKHWFRVEDRIRREAWSNDELALAVRLMALLNERWARDGKSSEDAGSACLDAGELASCAGCQSLARARATLSRLAARSGLTWRADGTRTLIEWHKYAEIQSLGSPTRGKVRTENAPSAPSPAPSPAEEGREEEEKESPPAAPTHSSPDVPISLSEPLEPDPPPKRSRAAPAPWSLRCAALLAECVRGVKGGVVGPRAAPEWAREIERLARDSPELAAMPEAEREARIEAGIRWAFGPENVGQYALVIRCGRSLREKWPRLVAAARRTRERAAPREDLERFATAADHLLPADSPLRVVRVS